MDKRINEKKTESIYKDCHGQSVLINSPCLSIQKVEQKEDIDLYFGPINEFIEIEFNSVIVSLDEWYLLN